MFGVCSDMPCTNAHCPYPSVPPIIFRRALSSVAPVFGTGVRVSFIRHPWNSLRLFATQMSALDTNPLVQDWRVGTLLAIGFVFESVYLVISCVRFLLQKECIGFADRSRRESAPVARATDVDAHVFMPRTSIRNLQVLNHMGYLPSARWSPAISKRHSCTRSRYCPLLMDFLLERRRNQCEGDCARTSGLALVFLTFLNA